MPICFEHDNCQLIYPNGAVFNITKRARLYYLKNIVSAKNATYDLHTWHKILGHCNESDIKKLPNLVKGMKIKPTPSYALNCDIYIQRKMSNDRNKTLDHKATKILAHVHRDLTGPTQPLGKEGYRKSISVSYDKQSPAYLIYFPESTAIKRVWCVKFIDSYNNPLMKHEDEHTELSDYISNIYEEKLMKTMNTEGEGQINQ